MSGWKALLLALVGALFMLVGIAELMAYADLKWRQGSEVADAYAKGAADGYGATVICFALALETDGSLPESEADFAACVSSLVPGPDEAFTPPPRDNASRFARPSRRSESF